MLMDASAWLEFFSNSDKGRRVREILDKEDCHTAITTLAEIVDVASRHGRDETNMLKTIKENSEIIEMNDVLAVLAGRLNSTRKILVKKWGMMDSFVLATSMLYNLKILTTDSDFKDIENVEIL